MKKLHRLKIKPHTSASKNEGFTLIEVLISLALLSIAITATMTFTEQNQDNLTQINSQDTATILAQKKMFELEQAGLTADISRTGSFGREYSDYQWQASVNPAPLPRTYILTLKIIRISNTKNYATLEKVFYE